MANEDLIGRKYVDEHDSGDLVMEIVAIDDFDPENCVIVKPVGMDRCWWRSASTLRPLLIEEQNGD